MGIEGRRAGAPAAAGAAASGLTREPDEEGEETRRRDAVWPKRSACVSGLAFGARLIRSGGQARRQKPWPIRSDRGEAETHDCEQAELAGTGRNPESKNADGRRVLPGSSPGAAANQ